MSKQEYVENIIKALRGIEGVGDVEITPNTRFSDIEAVDSMSIIDFQMNFRKLIGDKANDAVPVLDMSYRILRTFSSHCKPIASIFTVVCLPLKK